MTAPGETPPDTGSDEQKRLLPPFVLLGALVAMGALHQLAPGPELVREPWNHLGWIPFGLAFAVPLWVKLRFDKAGTPIHAFERTTALVTDGLYAVSRNPVYLAMIAAAAGIAVVLGTATPWLAIPPFAWFIQRRYIAVEEKALEATFGDDYRAYKKRVRRWL